MKKALLLLTVTLAAGRVFGQSAPQAVRKAPISITLKQDTIVYRIDHKTVNYGRVEQLLRTMPSFEVAVDGSVKHQGLPVKKITINGETYAGLTVLKIIQRLPIGAVNDVEMIDDYSNLSALNNFKGEPDKLMNLNIRPEAIADINYYLSNRPSRPLIGRRGLYDDPALYGDINYINERNPLDRQVNRAVRNMLAVSDQINEVDQYGDQIPHFLIPTPYPVRDVFIKRDKAIVNSPAPKALQLIP
jgi:hypothetical protein